MNTQKRAKWLAPLTTVLFTVLCAINVSGQDEYLNTKIGKISQKQIKNGKLVDYQLIDQTKGKVVIIEFWETWCAPCIQGMYKLKVLAENSMDAPCVNVLGITKTLENFFKMPVVTDITADDFYSINMKIAKDYLPDVDVWLDLFKDNGLVLRKGKKALKFIKIEKTRL